MATETQASDGVWTTGRLLTWTTQYLDRADVDAPRLSAELLLAHALNCRKIELYTRFDAVPDDNARSAFRELVRRAADHEPIAYLVAHKEFYSLDFEVSPAVLIPRPETELLVDRAVEFCRRTGEKPVRFLDVGTGSGCIAVAILSQAKNATGVATDVSAEALEVAQRNRDRHKLADRLALFRADGLNLPSEALAAGRFDVLVSNPPYVPQGTLASLSRGVRNFEPVEALCGGDDGLAFYRVFAARAADILAPGGTIVIEIGADQRDAVVDLFDRGGRFAPGEAWRDPGGPHDRVLQFNLQKG